MFPGSARRNLTRGGKCWRRGIHEVRGLDGGGGEGTIGLRTKKSRTLSRRTLCRMFQTSLDNVYPRGE